MEAGDPDPVRFFRSSWKTEMSSLSKLPDDLMELQALMGNLYLVFCSNFVSLVLFNGSFQGLEGWKGG